MIIYWLLLAGSVAFIVWQIFASRLETRPSDAARYLMEDVATPGAEDALLAFDLGARIFTSEDSRLVKEDTSAGFARWFDRERKALALDWLARVQTYVRQITSQHRSMAAQSRGLKPSNELQLAFQFLVFEMMGRILYCLILLCGPAELSRAVETFLSTTGRVRKLVEGAAHTQSPAIEL